MEREDVMMILGIFVVIVIFFGTLFFRNEYFILEKGEKTAFVNKATTQVTFFKFIS